MESPALTRNGGKKRTSSGYVGNRVGKGTITVFADATKKKVLRKKRHREYLAGRRGKRGGCQAEKQLKKLLVNE